MSYETILLLEKRYLADQASGIKTYVLLDISLHRGTNGGYMEDIARSFDFPEIPESCRGVF